MTRTPDQISRDIRESLSTTAPGLSMGIGTPERKIVDAVAEAISESYIDSYIVKSNWDIDSLSGMELEQLVGLFGFGRLLGRRATGTVTFSVGSPAQQNIHIPSGSQVFVPETSSSPLTVFITTTPAILAKGTESVGVPVECMVAGSIGNVPIDRITGFGNQLGFNGVTNQEPTSGGVDAESDEALRTRFKSTFLRNIAGTEDFYRGICLEHESVSKVKVIGPQVSHQEQLQVSSGQATSQIPNAKYVWPLSDFIVRDITTEKEEYFVRNRDYTIEYTVPPVINVIDSEKIPNGSVVDVYLDYTPEISRNNPENGITNKIDIFVNGADHVEVSEEVVQTLRSFSNSPDSPIFFDNFRDIDGYEKPTVGNQFVQLGCVPIATFPDIIEVGGSTYQRGTDYRIQRNVMDVEKNTKREVCGIEWISTNKPMVGESFVVDYTYNRLPEVLDAIIKESKQIATDPLVHVVDVVPLRVNLVIIYVSGYPVESVDASVEYTLSRWFSGLDIGSWIQFSDIEALVAGVSGVDAVRVARSGDGSPSFGIEEMRGGTVEKINIGDFLLGPSQSATLHSMVPIRRSHNTFLV